jgi:hypothetical protein
MLHGMRLFATLLLAAALAPAQVKITQETDKVSVEIDGKPFTEFVLRGGNAMKPYLYPLQTASGKSVTRHLPTELVTGEPTDHPHQRGLWFGHEKVNGFDFWNNETNYTTKTRGTITVDKVTEAKGGKKSGTIGTLMTWSDPDGKKLLEETRKMTFTGDGDLRIIDIDINLKALTNITFGDAKDGVFGIRLVPSLQEVSAGGKTGDTVEHSGMLVNADGGEHEKGTWGKLSNWVDDSGDVGGEKVGIAIMEHPSNSRRSYWHVRGYGLLAANPFGSTVFDLTLPKDTPKKDVPLESGGTMHFRYRVVIHPGDAKSAGIAKLWEQYSK